MGLHTKNLDSIINKLIPKEILPTILSNSMENEIKKLIEYWEETTIDETRLDYIADTSRRIIGQLQSLLKFKHENCCGKAEGNETNKN